MSSKIGFARIVPEECYSKAFKQAVLIAQIILVKNIAIFFAVCIMGVLYARIV
jgi:hypothetical protein